MKSKYLQQIILLQSHMIKQKLLTPLIREYKNIKAKRIRAQSKFITQSNDYADSYFDSIEKQLSGQNNLLTLQIGCKCKICLKQQDLTNMQQDHYLKTTPNAFVHLFTLLQHLTMIEADECPKVLGQFHIPMIFFKKQNRNVKKIQKRSSKKKNSKQTQQSFILFKSNPKSGLLEYPRVILTLEEVSKLMVRNQISTRIEIEQQQRDLRTESKGEIKEKAVFAKVIHKNSFDTQIPSLILPWGRDKKSRSAVNSFVLHQQDKYVETPVQKKIIKPFEQLCIARYLTKEEEQKLSKYQILTVESFDAILNNRSNKKMDILGHNKNLELIYIESYIKSKSQQNKNNGQQNHLPKKNTIHFTQYNYSEEKVMDCQLKGLARNLILIKTKKMAKSDSKYRDPIDLQKQINSTFYSNSQNDGMKLLAKFSTYKLVYVLLEVCGIIVKSLELKWMVRENGKIVLVECLKYEIDFDQTFLKQTKKNAHMSQILRNGIEYLRDGIPEDKQMAIEKKEKIEQMVRNMLLQKNSKRHEITETQDKEKQAERLSFSFNVNQKRLKQKMPSLKLLKQKIETDTNKFPSLQISAEPARYKKSLKWERKIYRLRPFKTQASSPQKNNPEK